MIPHQLIDFNNHLNLITHLHKLKAYNTMLHNHIHQDKIQWKVLKEITKSESKVRKQVTVKEIRCSQLILT